MRSRAGSLILATVALGCLSAGCSSSTTDTSESESASSDGGDTGGMEESGETGEPPPDEVSLAVIGDFGDDRLVQIGVGKLDVVADLVKSWSPDHVITAGDNNYPDGEASTIDDNVGQYYAEFIGDYQGAYGPGSETNRFWPSPGNHDWEVGLGPYIDYFTLPGNERYYHQRLGPVDLFIVDSESEEPDGATADSVQGQWLQAAMADSEACFKLVVFHRPAWVSKDGDGTERMRWPFAEWGADAVIAGHEHFYERLEADGIPYFISGNGGSLLYVPDPPIPQSQFIYADNWGAMRILATQTEMTFESWTIDDELVDTFTIDRACAG